MPLGIIGATGICTILYIIMCIVICMMVPYADIDTGAPFSSAFGYVGLPWAKYVPACLMRHDACLTPHFMPTFALCTVKCPLCNRSHKVWIALPPSAFWPCHAWAWLGFPLSVSMHV